MNGSIADDQSFTLLYFMQVALPMHRQSTMRCLNFLSIKGRYFNWPWPKFKNKITGQCKLVIYYHGDVVLSIGAFQVQVQFKAGKSTLQQATKKLGNNIIQRFHVQIWFLTNSTKVTNEWTSVAPFPESAFVPSVLCFIWSGKIAFLIFRHLLLW